jgi:uncharacterized protein with PIN domain
MSRAEHINMNQFWRLWHMNTAIPPTVLSEILASKSCPETIVALLNAAEEKYCATPKHYNQRRVYPFWKVCQHCKQPYMALTKEQATRSMYCGKKCMGEVFALARTGKPLKPIEKRKGKMYTCPVCGKEFWRGDYATRPVKTPMCSQHCNGVVRGRHLVKHAHKGRSGWTEQSYQSYQEKMTGPNNPAWKGGLTYRNRKGAYANQPIKYVRCPLDYLSMARKDGYVMEHRIVVARAMGRVLQRTEVVHHINHDATDNRLENLMLFATNAQHKAYEGGKGIAPLWCGLCHSTTPGSCGACVCRAAHSSLSETA